MDYEYANYIKIGLQQGLYVGFMVMFMLVCIVLIFGIIGKS